MVRVLVVDGEPASAVMISNVLTRAGYEVAAAGTGAAALKAAAVEHPDLIILELILPDMRGEDLLAALLAARPGRRVMVVSSVTDISTRVAVLSSGAVDYLAKPFANLELVARVRARMREPETAPPEDQPPRPAGHLQLGLDTQRRTLIVDGQEIRVTSTEFLLLAYLLQRAPDVCTRDDLLAIMRGTTTKSGNLVEVHISRLRRKLAPTEIQNVRNAGYRLIIRTPEHQTAKVKLLTKVIVNRKLSPSQKS